MADAKRSHLPYSRLDRILTFALLLFAAIYAIFLYREGSPYAGGSDSSGYFNSARLLSQWKFFETPRYLSSPDETKFTPYLFQPLGFAVNSRLPQMAPTYPLGLPIHLAIGAKLGGWDRAALLVNIFSTIGTGVFFWLLVRHFLFPPAWAVIAVIWLWLSPQYIFCAIQPMSDSLALLWSLATLYTALRSREGPAWCISCGIAFSIAVLVRPTNALLALPVLFASGFRLLDLLWIIIGGIPGAVLLGTYNFHVYGTVLTTGYGAVGGDFSSANILHNLKHVAHWTTKLLSPLAWLSLAIPFMFKKLSKETHMLFLWALLLAGFYSLYSFTGQYWWYLRFILPAFPIVILSSLLVIREIPLRSTAVRHGVLIGTLIFSISWEIKTGQDLHLEYIVPQEKTYRDVADWVKANLPANSAVFCMQVSGALYFYTDFTLLRWDYVEPGNRNSLNTTLRVENRPIYAVLYDFEIAGAQSRIGGDWEKITNVGLASIWRKIN